MNRRTLLLISATAVLAMVTGSWAYWTTSGSGATSASVGSLNAPPKPILTHTKATSTVEVNWPPGSTLSNGITPAQGYYVTRYNGVTTSPACGTSPASLTTLKTCTDSSVPDGTYTYQAIAVWNSFSATSVASAPVIVDTTPPTNVLSLTSKSGGGSYLSGTTLYYQGSALGSFKIQNALTDSGSGPASSAFPALGGTTTGWTHTGSTVSTPAGGPYVSNEFKWTAGTSSSPTETVTGADVDGNTAATMLTFTRDISVPTGTITYTNGYNKTGTVEVTFSASDVGSGVNTAGGQLKRATATLTSGTCGGFGSFENVGPEGVSSPYNDSSVATSKCYEYEYIVADNVGNQATITSASIVKVDTVAPTNALTLTSKSGGGSFLSGTTLYYQGSALGSFKIQNAVADTGSGPASSEFPALGGTTTGWTHTGSTVSTPAGGPYVSNEFKWTASTSSSPTETVTGADAAGNTTAAGLTFTSDTTAPSGGSISVPAYANATAVSVTFSAGTDEGSGVNTAGGQLKRATATYTIATDTCGSFGSFENVGSAGPTSPFSDTSIASGKCYEYEYVVADNVGNSTTYGPSTPVKIDTSVPTGTITYTNGYNKTGTVEVTFSASDTGSGVNTASGQLKRATATLTSGTCGGFGSFENVGPEGVSSPYNDSSVATSHCYKYEYVVADNVGNQATITSASIVKVDTVAPTNALTLTSKSGGGSFLSGTTLYYQGSVLGSFKIQNAVADSGSGPASSAFPALGGTTTGWTHTGSTVSEPAGGPYVSNEFKWTASTSSSPTETITGADAAGNTTVVPALTFTSDTTAPSGGSISVPAYAKTTAVVVTFSAGTDEGSGVNTAGGQLKRAEATYTELTDTCGSFGAFASVGSEGQASPFENTGLTKGKCYEYEYIVSDNVGNSTTYGPSTPVKVDTTAPEPKEVTSTDPEGKTASGEIKNGATLTITFKSRIDPASIGAGCPGSCVITGAKETRAGNENVFLVIPGITTAGGSSTGSTKYLSGTETATATFTATVAFSSNNTVLTVTVSELAGSTPAASEGKLKFAPAPTITDPAGNAATGSIETGKIKLF